MLLRKLPSIRKRKYAYTHTRLCYLDVYYICCDDPMIETRLISRQRQRYWHYVPDCLLATAIRVLLNALR